MRIVADLVVPTEMKAEFFERGYYPGHVPIPIHEPHPGLPVIGYELLIAAAYAALCLFAKEQSIMLP